MKPDKDELGQSKSKSEKYAVEQFDFDPDSDFDPDEVKSQQSDVPDVHSLRR